MKEEVTRILIIGMHDKIGGVETFLMNYFRNINRKKICFDFINMYDRLCFQDDILALGGKIYNIANVKKNPIQYFKQLTQVIKTNNYNIVHINMLSVANPLPIIVAHRLKVKNIIIHSHNANIPKGIIRKIMDKFNKYYLRFGTQYWACSKLAGVWMFGNKAKFEVINNAIDTEKYKFDLKTRNEIREELDIKNEFLIGHIGRFSYQKNHDFIIDVFNEVQKSLTSCKLLLIGDGEIRKKIEKKVETLDINKNVIFLGNTNEVQRYLQAMDIFILPSRFEGLPVTGIEAQVNGLKCLFSNNITKEVDISNKCIFIENNIEKWKKAIVNNSSVDNHDRNIKFNELYDIKIAAKELENKYIKMIRLYEDENR